jgi:hypothetical protein
MKLIINFLGKQSESDLSFMTEDFAIDFVKKLESEAPAVNLHEKFIL